VTPDLARLVELVRAHLTDDLLRPESLAIPRRTSSAGHCYVASETIYHLTGRTLRPVRIVHESTPHWFLIDTNGNVVDATADQFATPVPYDQGRRRPFRTRRPSKRAQILIRRVLTGEQT
jgi:hypothetical protein